MERFNVSVGNNSRSILKYTLDWRETLIENLYKCVEKISLTFLEYINVIQLCLNVS